MKQLPVGWLLAAFVGLALLAFAVIDWHDAMNAAAHR
jgi:hypothetical protein